MLVSVDNQTCSADVKVHLYWYCADFVLGANTIIYTVSNDTIFLKVGYQHTGLMALSYPDTLITLSNIPSGNYVLKCNLYSTETFMLNPPLIPVDSMNMIVEIPQKFNFNPFPDQLSICNYGQQDNILLNGFSEGIVSYSWLPDGETSSSIYINTPGKYLVSVADTAGCLGKDSVMVIEDCPITLFIPNAFAPNGDGENDLFLAKGEGIKKIHMVIFNRWGEKIMETDSYGKGWDGTYKGVLAEQGVYIYSINAESVAGSKVKRIGHLTLIK